MGSRSAASNGAELSTGCRRTGVVSHLIRWDWGTPKWLPGKVSHLRRRLTCFPPSSTACQFTSEIGAHWLSQCFRGELALPSAAEMDAEIERVRRWMTETFPARDQGYFIGPYLGHYTDELLRDMGLSVRRASSVIREYFGPLWSSRYRTISEERRRARMSDDEAVAS